MWRPLLDDEGNPFKKWKETLLVLFFSFFKIYVAFEAEYFTSPSNYLPQSPSVFKCFYQQKMGSSKKTRVVRSSVGSIGMGVGVPQVSHPFDETRSNLVAEGKTSFDRSLYNIVQYVFQCPKHTKVAITPIANTGGIIWIPYAVLPNDKIWEESSEHGLKYFFGQFAEVDTVDGRRAVVEGNGVMPRYEMNIIELLRVQLPSERVEVRLTISVKLFQTEK